MRRDPDVLRLDGRRLRRIVTAAVSAPSIHKSQPWRFSLYPDGVELHADPSRMLRVVDSRAGELHISCGAALFVNRSGVDAVLEVPLSTEQAQGLKRSGDTVRGVATSLGL